MNFFFSGFAELIVIFLVMFLVIGPKRLPEAATKLGSLLYKIKILWNRMTESIDKIMHDSNAPPPLTNNYLHSILPFLIEIRTRLLYILALLAGVLCCLLPFNKEIFNFIVQPLQAWLPLNKGHLVATQVTSVFIVPLKVTLYISLLLTMPFVLYQIWSFVAPALYKTEKIKIWPLLLFSLSLFYGGLLFAFYFVLPLVFHFFVSTAPASVLLMTDIGAYLDFINTMLIAFGIVFQCPMVIFLLVKFNLVNLTTLSRQRPYFIIFAFIIGMLLTPPDVFSQVLLAVPLCLLFEIGILLAKFSKKALPP